jgi:hypothetical protein
MDMNSDHKSPKPEKKAYKKPVLENHGRIVLLTTGGSGVQQEMGGMQPMGMAGDLWLNSFP